METIRTLVTYDTTGYVLDQRSGAVREPVGIPFIWVDVPTGGYITSVDVSVTPNVATIAEPPVSHMIQLQSDVVSANSAIDMILTELIPTILDMMGRGVA